MLLTTHHGNVAQIRAVIKAYGAVWIHGDGNLFPDDEKGREASDFHKDYHNPTQQSRAYRVKFTQDDMNNGKLPKNKEDLDNMLLKAKNQDQIAAAAIQQTANVRNIVVEDDDFVAPAGEIDYSKYTRKTE